VGCTISPKNRISLTTPFKHVLVCMAGGRYKITMRMQNHFKDGVGSMPSIDAEI
jgi:hypothetical protein